LFFKKASYSLQASAFKIRLFEGILPEENILDKKALG